MPKNVCVYELKNISNCHFLLMCDIVVINIPTCMNSVLASNISTYSSLSEISTYMKK